MNLKSGEFNPDPEGYIHDRKCKVEEDNPRGNPGRGEVLDSHPVTLKELVLVVSILLSSPFRKSPQNRRCDSQEECSKKITMIR